MNERRLRKHEEFSGAAGMGQPDDISPVAVFLASDAAALIKNVPGMLERLKVKVEKTTIDGVRA